MIQLPTQKLPPTNINPRVLVIYSRPKVGKTPTTAGLSGNLIIDLEDGSDMTECLKVNVIGLRPPSLDRFQHPETEAQRQARYNNKLNGNPKPLYYLTEVITALRAGHNYSALTIDTLSKLEDWAEMDATIEYMLSPIGKAFNRYTVEDQNMSKGTLIAGTLKPMSKWESVLNLPYGVGNRWLQDSFRKWIGYFRELTPRLILNGHVRVASINKAGKEVESSDLDLIGKVKSMTTGLIADATGYMYRKGNKNFISFQPSDEVNCGSRSRHLEGKEILISEKMEDGTIKTFWENIYI